MKIIYVILTGLIVSVLAFFLLLESLIVQERHSFYWECYL